MAYAQTPVHDPSNAVDWLVTVLSGPLPSLPDGDTRRVIREVREMQTQQAVAIWGHPGWRRLVGWVLGRVPECDPTAAAVHAVRNAERAVADPGYARSLSGYLRQVALHGSTDRSWGRRFEELTWDPPAPGAVPARPASSLSDDTARLLELSGVRVAARAWSVIGPSVDIAVDWWDALASRTGLVGDDLVAAARQPSHTRTEGWRLRANFEGPAARPLVALLAGGDQQGRRVREVAGVEAGLLSWSLLARRAASLGQEAPVPPAPVRRAWATTIGWIEQALNPNQAADGPTAAPTVAA